jgi:hypothetical protein
MSVIQGNVVGAGTAGYTIDNSLRFRASASAYLNRTFGTATSTTTGTWSGWVKRGSLGSVQCIWSSANYEFLRFKADDKIEIAYLGNLGYVETYSVFRDTSAWLHIVLIFDTSNATAANRMRLYVNGVQHTLNWGATPQTQNAAFQRWNVSGYTGDLGDFQFNHTYFLDGYQAADVWVDGQALTPSDFGEENADGVWVPKAYTGTYGNNGFYLPFDDATSTTTLGYDRSGNSNNWTCNNISLTAGVTYDHMVDTPTNNYATFSPISKSANVTLSNANLKMASSGNNYGGEATQYMQSGKWYAEFTGFSTNNECSIGLCGQDSYWRNYGWGTNRLGNFSDTRAWGYYSFNGNKDYNGTSTAFGSSYGASSTDVVMVAYDADSGKIWFGKNGTWAASGDPAAGTNEAFSGATAPLSFAANVYGPTGAVIEVNFGQRPFAYTPPTGFNALCTANLPEVAIVNPREHFDVVTYIGNDATNHAITGSGHTPDMVWIKDRTTAYDHHIWDILRGTGRKSLNSNSTLAEGYYDCGLVSFDSDGFTIDYGGGFDVYVNKTNDNFVAWLWKANGAGVSNTDGTITSTVSANQTAGFSIATFTTPASFTNATVGHGLNKDLAMAIVKSRTASGSTNWMVWHKAFSSSGYILLNSTAAANTSTNIFNGQSTTTLTLGNSSWWGGTDYFALFWAEIPGYSKFGSYVGNGSTDGPFVFCGFRPRFILVKNVSASWDWHIRDVARSTYNPARAALFPNLSTNEASASAYDFDILANGFKLRTTEAYLNGNTNTFIFCAFAEHPTGGSNVAPSPAR